MLFARKDETVSTLQSKYNGGTGAMSIDDYARWLSRVTLAVAIIMIGWGLSVILIQPVTAWFATSSMIWMALLLISAIWQLRGSFPAIVALALATAVVSRLFSILRLNPPADIAGLKPDDPTCWSRRVRAYRVLRFWVGFWVLLCSSNSSCGPHPSQHRRIRQKYRLMSWL
jgi:putative oxidoreductase